MNQPKKFEQNEKREFSPQEKQFIREKVNYFQQVILQYPQMDNGVNASLFVMSIAYEIQPIDLRQIQEMLLEMGSDIYLLGIPTEKYIKSTNAALPDNQQLVVSEVFFPHFVNGEATGDVLSSDHKNIIFGTVRPNEKNTQLKSFGLTEDENLKNLENAGIPRAETVNKFQFN